MQDLLLQYTKICTDDMLERYAQLQQRAAPLEDEWSVREPSVDGSAQLLVLLATMRQYIVHIGNIQSQIYALRRNSTALEMCKWCRLELERLSARERGAERMNKEALMLADVRYEMGQQALYAQCVI